MITALQEKYHYTADILTRKLANRNTVPSTIPEEEMKAHSDSIIAAIPASDKKMSQITAKHKNKTKYVDKSRNIVQSIGLTRAMSIMTLNHITRSTAY